MCSLIYLLGGYSINNLIDSMYRSNSNFIYFCGMFSGFSAELQQCNMFPNLRTSLKDRCGLHKNGSSFYRWRIKVQKGKRLAQVAWRSV